MERVNVNSDSWLSKNIRPLVLAFLSFCLFIIIVAEIFGARISPAITYEVSTLLGGACGFYFYSRRMEKMAIKDAETNIELEKLKQDGVV